MAIPQLHVGQQGQLWTLPDALANVQPTAKSKTLLEMFHNVIPFANV